MFRYSSEPLCLGGELDTSRMVEFHTIPRTALSLERLAA